MNKIKLKKKEATSKAIEKERLSEFSFSLFSPLSLNLLFHW
jgi:hypothetical protein